MHNAEWHCARYYDGDDWVYDAQLWLWGGDSWHQASPEKRDSFPPSNGVIIEWPCPVPNPPRAGMPPRQVW